jgi:hypothetical protein
MAVPQILARFADLAEENASERHVLAIHAVFLLGEPCRQPN